jgi:hypothetical protein
MAKPLLMNGKQPFSIVAPPHPRRVELAAFLDNNPGTIFDRACLIAKGFSKGLLTGFADDLRFLAYSHKDGFARYYGAPSAIEECKREIKRQREVK